MTPSSGSGCIPVSFAYFWDPFPPIGLPCTALILYEPIIYDPEHVSMLSPPFNILWLVHSNLWLLFKLTGSLTQI